MKKTVLICFLALFAFMAQAQTYTPRNASNNALDTVTNTGTKTLSASVPGSGTNVTVQLFATKISGTVAGTAYLYGSLDGVNYGQISSTTYSMTDVASQSFLWVLSNHPVSYYQIRIVGSGTSSYSFYGKVLRRGK